MFEELEQLLGFRNAHSTAILGVLHPSQKLIRFLKLRLNNRNSGKQGKVQKALNSETTS